MHAKQIGQCILLASFATAPLMSWADAGQAAGTQKQTEAAQEGKAAASGQDQKNAAAKTPDTVLMLVPVVVASKDNAMKSGCWARIYSRANYSGDTMTLSGPLAIADMTGPFGLDWDDKVDSVEVGPKATLAVFDNEQFRDQVALFKPGQKVPDISKKLGFFDEFASVRLSCAKS